MFQGMTNSNTSVGADNAVVSTVYICLTRACAILFL
jgi:hypothetical protein